MVGGEALGALAPLSAVRPLVGPLVRPWARGWAWPVRRRGPSALLVDQLGEVVPGEAFAAALRSAVGGAGYRLEVVPPEAVNVARLANLPASGAKLIVLRVHSALVLDGGRWTDDAALFTNEPVDLDRYAVTGLAAPLGPPSPPLDPPPSAHRDPPPSRLDAAALAALVPVRRTAGGDGRPYLGLGPAFVRDHLRGTFAPGTTIVLMGCDGLRGRALSEAFLARGADAVIGWSDLVSAAHTDRATLALVADLAAGRTPTAAIRRAMLAAGRDPVSGAYLIGAVR